VTEPHDVGAAARALAASGKPGALIQIEARTASLVALRAGGLTRTDEGILLEAAWTLVHRRLPEGAVAHRAGWTGLDVVLAGERPALVAAARGLLGALVGDPETARIAWQVALIKIAGDADRVLLCDARDDLGSADGDLLAWIEPYDGDDWRVAGRYPNVTFEPTLATRR
jgi:hypothetical protein